MRNEKAIPFLLEMLNDGDPKIICQAIRGLQVFDNEEIKTKLKALINNENETVKNLISHDYFSSNKKADIPHSASYNARDYSIYSSYSSYLLF